MSATQHDIRSAVIRILAEHGHGEPTPSESLFLSGKLDSVAAMDVLMLLEEACGVDLADSDFDISQIDTLQMLEQLAERQRKPSDTTERGLAGAGAKLLALPVVILSNLRDPDSTPGRFLSVLLEAA